MGWIHQKMLKMVEKCGNPINKEVPIDFFTYLDGRYSTHV
jgi:hypothetical protein